MATNGANPASAGKRGSVSDPKAEYSKRLESYLQIAAAKNRVHIQIGNFKLAVVAVGLVARLFRPRSPRLQLRMALVPDRRLLHPRLIHQRVIRARTRAETAAAMYRRGIARIEDRWAGTGQTGDRFRDPRARLRRRSRPLRPRLPVRIALHRASADGRKPARSLAEDRHRTRAEILERQQLVAELRDKLDLHRDLGVIGEELRARLNPESLVGWAEGKREMPGAIWHFAAVFLALAFIVTFAWSIAQPQLLARLVRARSRNFFSARAPSSRAPRKRRRFLQRRRAGVVRRCLAAIGARALRIPAIAIVDRANSSRDGANASPLDSPARANRILDRRASQFDRPSPRTPAALFHPGRIRRRVVAPPPRSAHARQRRQSSAKSKR